MSAPQDVFRFGNDNLGYTYLPEAQGEMAASYEQFGKAGQSLAGYNFTQRLGMKRRWVFNLTDTLTVERYAQLMNYWERASNNVYILADTSLNPGHQEIDPGTVNLLPFSHRLMTDWFAGSSTNGTKQTPDSNFKLTVAANTTLYAGQTVYGSPADSVRIMDSGTYTMGITVANMNPPNTYSLRVSYFDRSGMNFLQGAQVIYGTGSGRRSALLNPPSGAGMISTYFYNFGNTPILVSNPGIFQGAIDLPNLPLPSAQFKIDPIKRVIIESMTETHRSCGSKGLTMTLKEV